MNVPTPLYVAIAIVSVFVGVVGLFTIGAPFFLTGGAMLVLLPWRRRRVVSWPVLAAPWVFAIAFAAVAPIHCGSSSMGSPGSRTACTNVLGIDYSGGEAYRPPLMPAFIVGLVAAVLVAVALRWYVVRRTAEA